MVGQQKITDILRKRRPGAVIDLKSVLDSHKLPKTLEY
jgi:hypothetical protein